MSGEPSLQATLTPPNTRRDRCRHPVSGKALGGQVEPGEGTQGGCEFRPGGSIAKVGRPRHPSRELPEMALGLHERPSTERHAWHGNEFNAGTICVPQDAMNRFESQWVGVFCGPTTQTQQLVLGVKTPDTSSAEPARAAKTFDRHVAKVTRVMGQDRVQLRVCHEIPSPPWRPAHPAPCGRSCLGPSRAFPRPRPRVMIGLGNVMP